MRLRHYNHLRNFVVTARHDSLATAADELCVTKGALSHQIRNLEDELGFKLFERHPKGIALTDKGSSFLGTCKSAFDQIEREAVALRETADQTLTIGTTTYFASRWLSPRLMDFIRQHPEIRLRIQPTIETTDLPRQGIDLAIRWGNGGWTDYQYEKLFACPAWPTGNQEAMQQVAENGLEYAFSSFTLLRDHQESDAWSQWYQKAGLTPEERADTLIVRDPNVRVQAVLDGQGVALNDDLVGQDIRERRLFRLSEVELEDYGYFLVFRDDRAGNEAVAQFVDWIKAVDRYSALQASNIKY